MDKNKDSRAEHIFTKRERKKDVLGLASRRNWTEVEDIVGEQPLPEGWSETADEKVTLLTHSGTSSWTRPSWQIGTASRVTA